MSCGLRGSTESIQPSDRSGAFFLRSGGFGLVMLHKVHAFASCLAFSHLRYCSRTCGSSKDRRTASDNNLLRVSVVDAGMSSNLISGDDNAVVFTLLVLLPAAVAFLTRIKRCAALRADIVVAKSLKSHLCVLLSFSAAPGAS